MMSLDRFEHYKLNIPIIDNDHYQLLLTAGNICNLVKEHNHDEAELLLKHLSIDLKKHFEKEESFLRVVEYKYLEYHISDHHKITKELESIELKNHMYDFEIKSLAQKIEDMLIKHIDQFDMQYADIVKNNQEIYNHHHA